MAQLVFMQGRGEFTCAEKLQVHAWLSFPPAFSVFFTGYSETFGKPKMKLLNSVIVSAVRAIGGWNETLKSRQEHDLLFRLLQADFRSISDESRKTIIHAQEDSTSRRTIRRSVRCLP